MSSRIRREEKRLSHFADEAETRLNPARGKQERPRSGGGQGWPLTQP